MKRIHLNHEGPGRADEQAFRSNGNPVGRPLRLRISHVGGFELLVIDEIAYLEADSSVTHILLAGGRKVIGGRNLGHYEDILAGCGFCRTHHRYLISLAFVRQYQNRDHVVTLATGSTLPVAQQRLKEFLEQVERITG